MFASKNLTAGQLNALVKKLGGETVVLAILGGVRRFTLEACEDQPYNGSIFFRTRTGLYVKSSLDRYVGLDGHTTRGTQPKGRVIERNSSETELFGKPGTDKHAAALTNAVDLGQIETMIKAQWNGQQGDLLTNCYANIFPVVGKNGALHVVNVYRDGGKWFVRCEPFQADYVWHASIQVFSN